MGKRSDARGKMAAPGKPDSRVQYANMRNGYGQHWEVDMWQAPCKAPGCCLASVFCPPCVAYHIRRRVLYNDLRSYLCCGGYCPCSGRMCESSCPWLCLAMEVTLCYPQSVFVTRFMIQDEMRIGNTQCDNCIIGTVIALQYLACIFQIIGTFGAFAQCMIVSLAKVLSCVDKGLHTQKKM